MLFAVLRLCRGMHLEVPGEGGEVVLEVVCSFNFLKVKMKVFLVFFSSFVCFVLRLFPHVALASETPYVT